MSYIGNEPIVSATRTVTEVSATAGQTVFYPNGGYTVGKIDVIVNGAQLQSSDFTATNGSSVTLTTACSVGDDVKLVAWGVFSSSNVTPSSLSTGAPYWDTLGNVGIGTSSPAALLQVGDGTGAKIALIKGGTSGTNGGGAIVVQNGGTSNIGIGNYSAINGGAYNSFPVLWFQQGLAFFDNATERMRLSSLGRLLIGTTSESYSGVTARQTISYLGASNEYGLGFRPNADNTVAIWFANAAGSGVGNITTSSSATAYNTSSDYRLKENIAPMTGSLAKVAQLKPVTYTWKSTGEASQGFIAHELQEIVPDCVTGEKDAVDAEGNPIYQGIDTSFLVATLTAAIQELKAEVDSLKAQISG